MNVYQRLNEAREKFHSLKLQKTGHNKFAGYYYFELSDFLVPALKVFNECGLCAVVSFSKDTASMMIRSIDKPEDYIAIDSPMGSAALKGCHEVQNIGAVETYQRRYLWVAALEIVEHDALDATTGKGEGKAQKPAKVEGLQVSGPSEAYKALSDDWKAYVDDLAVYVSNLLAEAGAAGALDHIQAQELEPEVHAALWSKLDSKTRSALDKLTKGQPQKEAA